MTRLHHLKDGAQHRGVQRVVQGGDARVITVDREQVLGEIVAADGEKIHAARDLLRLVHRRRHLDHHTQRRHCDVLALLEQLAVCALHETTRLVHLGDLAHHGQQQTQVVHAGARPQHGAQLHEEDFGMIERDADAAPAKKGIVFMDREIRERLVAADIERAQHHRPRREGLQHLTIDAPLLLLAGEAVADHEGEFGAIEADALRAVRERQRNVGDEARIGAQGQAHTVRRLGWQVAQALQAGEELRLFVGETRVLAAHRLGGIGIHAATVAVDDERASLHASGGEVTGAHHRGHTHRARERLVGVVSASGSRSSHVAILARAMGVPAVVGAGDLPAGRMEGRTLIVDGYRGRVYSNPSEAVRSEYARLANEEAQLLAGLQGLRDLPAETPDGVRLPLYANSGLIADVSQSLANGAEGSGLYRTEFPFMIRDRFPGEEEQRRIYRLKQETNTPQPKKQRTHEDNDDKPLSYFPIHEDNPFLGGRGIRITLDHPEIFLVQLRAMLRASAGLNNLRLLLPMVSQIAEVDEARRLVERAHRELLEQGEDIAMPALGVM